MKKPKGIEATIALISTIIIALVIFVMIRYFDEKLKKSRDTSRLINAKEITKLIINYRIFQERNYYDEILINGNKTTSENIAFILGKQKMPIPKGKKNRDFWYLSQGGNFLITVCGEIPDNILIADGMGGTHGISCINGKPIIQKESPFWQGTNFKLHAPT